MKTDDLISLLATGAAPVPTHSVGRRFALALGLGIVGAVLLLVLTHGLRADLAQAMGELIFWVKMAFAGVLALAAYIATERLARPGMRVGGAWAALAAPVLLLWLVAALVLLGADPEQRAGLILGATWNTCPFSIALISLPLFVATFWVMKGLAPTRPAWAGASAGLLAGALAALVYALHCPESGAPFIGIWYVVGIAIPAAVGALLGPRTLRW
ncbi:NrsF family protein [Candidatus Aalborgicola defluviihabitans]|uniref:NrsF family protein n=1 Tax=Candidatus Aalborgicola defluviihabitans TaxID=3386187 RepID=UPI00390B6BCE|nr:DUF1109 domain-containing protein [Burkholderiales bacterium]